jgi:hypothetical protein
MAAKSGKSAAELRALLRQPSSATEGDADDVPLQVLAKAKGKAKAKAKGAAKSVAKAPAAPAAPPTVGKAGPAAKAKSKAEPASKAKSKAKAKGEERGLKRQLSAEFDEVSRCMHTATAHSCRGCEHWRPVVCGGMGGRWWWGGGWERFDIPGRRERWEERQDGQ